MELLIIRKLSCLRTKNENKEQERRKERKGRRRRRFMVEGYFMVFSLPDIASRFVWNCRLKSCIWLCFLPYFVKQRENFHKFSNFSLKTFGFGL